MRKRLFVLICATFVINALARTAETKLPTEFWVGRHIFFDFGPPSDYYEVFWVRPAAMGSLVTRINVTPPGIRCIQPATIKVVTVSIPESVADLLGRTNPCTIPGRELHREEKRCKHCLTFSGAHIAMQVECGSGVRTIRMNVLDRDMFDRAPQTPEHTSWTMRLLEKIDSPAGPGPMDEPIYPVNEPAPSKPTDQSANAIVAEIAAGKFDPLFEKAPDKVSTVAREAMGPPPPPPTAELIDIAPFQPISIEAPKYPQLARLARIEGKVSFVLEVAADGSVRNLRTLSGHPFLQASAVAAISSWKFAADTAGHEVKGTVEFKLNCSISGS